MLTSKSPSWGITTSRFHTDTLDQFKTRTYFLLLYTVFWTTRFIDEVSEANYNVSLITTTFSYLSRSSRGGTISSGV